MPSDRLFIFNEIQVLEEPKASRKIRITRVCFQCKSVGSRVAVTDQVDREPQDFISF